MGIALAIALTAAPLPLRALPPMAELAALDRELRTLHEPDVVATDGEVRVYIGSPDPAVLLRRIRLRVDEQAPLTYEYSAAESAALRAGGLHVLPPLPLAEGEHRLRVELTGRRADARPDTPRVHATLDRRFTVRSPMVLALDLTGPGLLRAAAVHMGFADAATPAQDARAVAFESAMRAPAPVQAAGADDAIARYNAAVAMLAGADPVQGEQQLDALGRGDAQRSIDWTVRDLANVTLGYARLRARRGAAAIEPFGRVRSPGPYGNAALLGLGWAHLLPRGGEPMDAAAPWWPQAEAASPALRRRMPFRYAAAVAGGARAQDLHRALVPWNELTGRDALDPAVQEGMLAVAYALHHLGAHAQARQHYQRAIERLQGALAQLDAALGRLDDGSFLATLGAHIDHGWRRWLADLPYADDHAYVRRLCEAPAFLRAYEAWRAWQDAAAVHADLARRLASRSPEGIRVQALRTRLDSLGALIADAQHDADAALRAETARTLSALRAGTRAYLAEAAFALARLDDPAPAATFASAAQR